MKIDKLLRLAPVEWERAIGKLTTNERFEVALNLGGIAANAASLMAYVEGRYGYGYTDMGHEKSMKRATKMRRKVRKAVGYTYP